MDVEQHGAGCVGVVRHVDLASRQVPDEPGVHRTGAQFPLLRPLPHAGNVIQHPADLGAGEVGIDQQAGFLRHRLAKACRLQIIADGGGAAALPHDGVIHRLSGGAVPQDGGLPLVGDAQRGDFLGVDVGAVHGLCQGPLLRGPDLHGVVLHPAGLGIDLAEWILGPGEDLALPVKEDRPGTGGSLIQRDNVSFHKQPPLEF